MSNLNDLYSAIMKAYDKDNRINPSTGRRMREPNPALLETVLMLSDKVPQYRSELTASIVKVVTRAIERQGFIGSEKDRSTLHEIFDGMIHMEENQA